MALEISKGTVINGYRIDGLLSDDGNFAIVYLAFDTDMARVQARRERIAGRLGRWRERYGDAAAQTRIDPGPYVALKEFFPQSFGIRRSRNMVAAAGGQGDVFAWGRERFLRESEFLADHSHPNVVAVFDRFSAHNTEYYVMERLAGGSLKKLVAGGQVQSEAQVLAWMGPILDALGSIERRNANHLDISPSNIMFRTAGGDPVLVDFGAARISGSTPVHKSRLVVTDPYSGPEKYHQTSSRLNASTDVYALGATAFYALSGADPIAGNSRRTDGPPVGSAAFGRIRHNVSERIVHALEKACDLDQSKRFDSAAAFAAALGLAHTTTPVNVVSRSLETAAQSGVRGAPQSRPGTTLVAQKGDSRKLVLMLGCGLVVLLLLIAVIIAIPQNAHS